MQECFLFIYALTRQRLFFRSWSSRPHQCKGGGLNKPARVSCNECRRLNYQAVNCSGNQGTDAASQQKWRLTASLTQLSWRQQMSYQPISQLVFHARRVMAFICMHLQKVQTLLGRVLERHLYCMNIWTPESALATANVEDGGGDGDTCLRLETSLFILYYQGTFSIFQDV